MPTVQSVDFHKARPLQTKKLHLKEKQIIIWGIFQVEFLLLYKLLRILQLLQQHSHLYFMLFKTELQVHFITVQERNGSYLPFLLIHIHLLLLEIATEFFKPYLNA